MQEKKRQKLMDEKKFYKSVESFFNQLFNALYKAPPIPYSFVREFFAPQKVELDSEKQQEYISRLLKYMRNNKENFRLQNMLYRLLLEIIQIHAQIIETDIKSYNELLEIIQDCIPSYLGFENRKNLFYEMFNASKLATEKLRNDPKNFPEIAGQQIFFALAQLDKKVFEKDSLQNIIDESGQTGKLIISAFMDSISLPGTTQINNAEKMVNALKVNLSPELATQIIKEVLSVQAKFDPKETHIEKFLKKLFQTVYGNTNILTFPSISESNTSQTVSPIFNTILESQTNTATAKEPIP